MDDLFAKYHLQQVINASGRMSALGVSTPSDRVMEAVKLGGQRYVDMSELTDKAGDYLAKQLDAEAAVVVNSASSGIVLSVAGMVTQGDTYKSAKLHQWPMNKNEIIILKGHNVHYGAPIETMVYAGGGQMIEAGFSNQGTQEHIKEAINEHTAAILYVKSHHAVQKNMISVEEAWETAQSNHLPFIIDAAAEEDLKKYIALSDLVIYSGSKALEGPTSGIVAGKATYVDWVKTQMHYIGRSMKVGKEMICGLLQAFDEYMAASNQDKSFVSLKPIYALNDMPGITVKEVQDGAGRAIYRARIYVDTHSSGISAKALTDLLKQGTIAIHTREHGLKQGFFEVDPRPLKEGEPDLIYKLIKAILEGDK